MGALFLGAFGKFAKVNCYSRHVCLSIRPPARVELGSHWTDFLKICLENQVSLK
jgi:hypothetical protein